MNESAASSPLGWFLCQSLRLSAPRCWVFLLSLAIAGAALGRTLAGAEPERLTVSHLPNAYRLHARVISGGQPEGEAAFAELQRLGVKTIISVDGATPEVELAARYGLRYVHLPHGYEGIAERRGLELAKAVRDLPGPLYIHCHHGKHRSPAAAVVACVTLGYLPDTQARHILTVVGTSGQYRGLYAAAEKARPVSPQILDELAVEYPSTAALPPLAEAMVAMEGLQSKLQASAKRNWSGATTRGEDHPAHFALLLREQYTELLRSDLINREPPAFRSLLQQGEQSALELEKILRPQDVLTATAQAEAGKRLAALSQNCTRCHQQFRDQRPVRGAASK